ncbi:MAG TPA: hypothetical protein VHV51_22315 [Polyangiaceae bacterium]|jgi:hypothetical protein|nr:hypothetical protein [Polyangiaceae bacterium]
MTIARIAGAAALAVALAACKKEAPAEVQPKPVQSHAAESTPPPLPSNIAASTNAALPAEPAARPHAPTLNVPRAPKPITPSDKFDVNVWGSAVNTHTLLDANGNGAVPVSEARFLWGDGKLYLAFYAGDLDLEMREKKHDGAVWKDDSFTVSFFVSGESKRVLTISPLGTLADGVCPNDAESLADSRCDLHWESHVRTGVDYDGTVNKLGDFDEEWNIQLAIPLSALNAKATPGTHVAFTLRRCDIAFDGQRACGLWGDPEHPAELVLE